MFGAAARTDDLPVPGARPCDVLECVVNISEGRDQDLIARLAAAAGRALLDVHTDEHHNRSVLTLVGEDAPRAVDAGRGAALDLGRHDGVHPRIGVVDVVPFVPLAGDDAGRRAVAARDRFAAWAADELGVPVFLLRARALAARGAPRGVHHAAARPRPGHAPPHRGRHRRRARGPCWWPTTCGSRRPTWTLARRLAAAVRGPSVRALGLAVGDRVQVSLNLIEPATTGPAAVFDLVDRDARTAGNRVVGAELVGLLPEAVLRAVDEERWAELDLAAERTIEARLAAGGVGEPATEPPGGNWRGDDALGERPRPGGSGAAHARSCRPRCRTSRRWRARTRGSPRARRSRGTPPWPRGWTPPARGRTDRGRRRGSSRSPASCALRFGWSGALHVDLLGPFGDLAGLSDTVSGR